MNKTDSGKFHTKGIWRTILYVIPGWWLPLICQSQVKDNPFIINENDFRQRQEFYEEINFDSVDLQRINAAIYYITNEIRQNNGLTVLKYDGKLECSARMHAEDMATFNFFSHINSLDKQKETPNDRARLCYIQNPYLAENIIEGFGLKYTANQTVYIHGKGKFSYTPDGDLIKPHTYLSLAESLLEGWMKSKDHLSNIMSTDALQLGCGVAFYLNTQFNDMPTFYAVQNFQLYHSIISVK